MSTGCWELPEWSACTAELEIPVYLKQFDLAVPLRPPVLLAEADDHHRLAHLLASSRPSPAAAILVAAAAALAPAAADVVVEHREEVLRVCGEHGQVVAAAARRVSCESHSYLKTLAHMTWNRDVMYRDGKNWSLGCVNPGSGNTQTTGFFTIPVQYMHDNTVTGVRTWQPFAKGDLDCLGGLDDAVVVEVRPERADRHLLELAAKVREELHPELPVVLPIFR